MGLNYCPTIVQQCTKTNLEAPHERERMDVQREKTWAQLHWPVLRTITT